MTRPEIIYSLAGGLPLTTNRIDFGQLVSGVKDAGYDGVGLLPFRALLEPASKRLVVLSKLKVAFIQEAWNPQNHDNLASALITGSLGTLARKLKLRANAPLIEDGLFPGKLNCEVLFDKMYYGYPSAKVISSTINPGIPRERCLIEAHNGLLQGSPQDLIEYSNDSGINLVFDPSHPMGEIIQRSSSMNGKPTQRSVPWEYSFNILKPNVEVVDIHPTQTRDIPDLLQGKGLLTELIQAAAEQPQISSLRVEVKIPLKDQLPYLPQHRKARHFLSELREAITEQLSD